MASKTALLAAALCAVVAFAGCTGGSDDDGDSTTSTSGSGGVGGGVTGPGVGGNATVSGSASGSGSMTNTSTGAPDRAEVRLSQTQFMPEQVTITNGGTVRWVHEDGTQKHTVTSDDGAWDSHPECASPVTPINDCLEDGESYEQTFPTPGTFAYHCKVHPEMTGVVNVVA